MAIQMEKITRFLRGPYAEGPQQLEGYIPCNLVGGGSANYKGGPNPERHVPMGVSGVTIATGVDLGQTSKKVLAGIGMDEADIRVFRPYLGKSGMDAVNALHACRLRISAGLADRLDHAMHWHHADLISARYDADAGQGVFASLPWQAQTAIFSILYQRGTGSPKKFPNTWAAFTRRDWSDASRRLCTASFWDGYQERRNREGLLLRELL